MRWKFVLFLPLCFTLNVLGDEDFCPKKCDCKKNNAQKGFSDFLKLKCGDTEKISEFDEIDLLNIANEIIQLNLSDNLLTTFYPKVQLIELQKLDLSRNHIKYLFKDQFAELPNLRRLDLSHNQIGQIDIYAFNNLKKLERLRLYQNQLSFILFGTFDPLVNLKQLEISNNPLICDCKILWILQWSQKTSVKLVSNPKCASPIHLKGFPLRKLKLSLLTLDCSSVRSYGRASVVVLKPSDKQIVFEGDSLTLQCKAPVIIDSEESSILSRIEWTFSNEEIPFPDIQIKNELLSSTELMESSLTIPKLFENHTGDYTCIYTTLHQNYSKSIEVFVISDETEFCPLSYSTNNKGTYTWPRSIVNNTVSITCESLNLSLNVSEQKANYFCSPNGTWENLDTSACQYVSEPTKILQQFSRINTSILESSELFRNYTSNLRMFRDVVDLRFAVDTIVNYLYYMPIEQVGVLLADVVDNLLDLPKRYVIETDREERICGKLLNATEQLASITPSPQLHKTNLALEEFSVDKDGFIGLKCTWYVNLDLKSDRLFYCENSEADAVTMKGKMIEASITIPKTLFHEIDQNLTSKIHKILVAMHTDNKLFPMDEERMLKEDVTSAVVGTKLVNVTVTNLTYPVSIRLRTPPSVAYEIVPFTPVWWDPSLNNGSGSWSTEGCEFNYALQDHLVFSCENFGYYGLLQDISQIGYTETSSKFRFSHPGIYVGSTVIFVTFFVATMTYLLCYDAIQMPKKAKHCLINVWMAIFFLCFMYIFGIYQTEDLRLCQIIGIFLHYFTLCSLLWICVAINCMYKRLSKNTTIELHDDELPSDQPVQKPILGLYLVGWGVAMIICGISAAININNYSSPNYCFLKIGQPLSALYIPFIVLSLFLFVFSLLVRCAIYNLDVNGHLSEGTQATENVDLDLLEPNFPNNAENRSVRSASTKTTSEIEDQEHAPIAQLKAYIIFLLMYVFTWLCCAFSTVQPFHFSIYEEDVFSWMYAVSATLFSAFTIFFYCVARNDVRTQWGAFCRWTRGKKTCFRTRNVSDNSNIPQIQIQPHHPALPAGNEVTITSRSSSRSSNNTKSNSHNSNMFKAADLNSSFTDSQGTKINNVNLISLHRQQYRIHGIPNIIENPTSAADVFYNPHQSTVARKFFKRQKRHLMKRTNLTARPQDSSDAVSVLSEPKRLRDDSSIDQKMFGTNSKVNNTNIHVEYVKKCKQKNPNIFSDSDNFESSNQVSVENIVKNADRLRKKELYKQRTKKKLNQPSDPPPPVENNMRSVSQQCTLEYSSENISDSILDKTSPDKNVLPIDDPFLMPDPGRKRGLSQSTEDDPTYCQINDVRAKIDDAKQCASFSLGKYDTSDLSSDVLEGATGGKPKMFLEPARENLLRRGGQMSRASSVSASDLDELYQQIRRGPKVKYSTAQGQVKLCRSNKSPCFSDSEISSYVKYVNYKYKKAPSTDNLSDNVETTV
ncbi:adhesion G protein-coupled receptor A3 [Coccinella septempunctata]|uniref:adhesion G protein-coupled receptor A3 n=1 Tax=Coccinella septempunctata TaxID=41139 RepID=UPI001D079631|nr:adhesion G protein-coupled receptor A3 [Coccinella septempunctata]